MTEVTDAVVHQLLYLESRLLSFMLRKTFAGKHLQIVTEWILSCWFCLQGDYVRLWVPELQGIKGADIHTPWALNSAALSQAGVALGETYPQPVVTAPEWSRHISQRPVSTGKVLVGWEGSRQLLCVCRSVCEFCSSFSGIKGQNCFNAKSHYLTAEGGPALCRDCAAGVI